MSNFRAPDPKTPPQAFPGLAKFLNVVAQLRDPVTGCPWDLEQSHESLLKYFAEEVQEFIEAMRTRGPKSADTWEELGDVMLQIALHTRIAAENGITNFDEVCNQAADKLILRHPHVFDPEFPKFKTANEVSANWEKIKAWARRKQAGQPNLGRVNEAVNPGSGSTGDDAGTPSAAELSSGNLPILPKSSQLDAVAVGLSPLLRAQRIGEKAAAFRFDWPDIPSVLDKVLEETEEFVAAQESTDEHQKEEFGDILFSLAQYARKRRWDSNELAERANKKFCDRFRQMESLIITKGQRWDDLNLEGLEAFWQAAKIAGLTH